MTAKDAAAWLGVSERTVRRAIEQGRLPATKSGGTFRVEEAVLVAFQANRTGRSRMATPTPMAKETNTSALAITPPPLPVPPTDVIGRDPEIAGAVSLLSQEHVRLVTLVGPGGVGKSRLALAVAGAVGDRFPAGVWWIPLATVSDPALVLPAITGALGIRGGGERPQVGRIGSHLRQLPALLVLDNLEQVIGAAADIGTLLEVVPGLKVLSTSREALNITAESTLPVAPLGLPGIRGGSHLSNVAASPAIQLFVARAKRSLPSFGLNADNAATIADICRKLDGLPLAIELAAGWVRLMTPSALLDRLDQRLPMLTGGPRDAPERHRTMRDAVAWSYDLLSLEERALFRDLAVFAGGATVEAIEAVCGGVAVIDPLMSLLDKNLVTRAPEGEADTRVVMLETVREFALELLDASESVEELHRRHAEWYLGLVMRVHRDWSSPEGAAGWRQLAADEANLRAAMTFFELQGDAEQLLNLTIHLSSFWYAELGMQDGFEWLGRATALGRAKGASRLLLARSLERRSGLASTDEARRRALLWLDEAQEIFRELESWKDLGFTLVQLGGQLQHLEDPASVARYAEAADVFRQIGHLSGLSLALWNQSDALTALGMAHLDEAEALVRESIEIGREHGYPTRLVLALSGGAQIALLRRKPERATALLLEQLDILEAIGFRFSLADAFIGFAGVAEQRGDPVRGARLLGAALAIREAIGSQRFLHEDMFQRVTGSIRARIDPAQFDGATEDGKSLSEEEAIREARAIAAKTSPRADSTSLLGANELSPRELEVLRLLCAGASNQTIAEALSISLPTAKRHVTNILGKLNVSTRAAAVGYAHRHGLA